MNDLEKYVRKQKIIGIVMAVVALLALIASILVFALVRINGEFIWYMIIPIVISLGMTILGVGWYVMIKNSAKNS